MLKTVYFDAHHRHKWQCFRIRLVDKKGCPSTDVKLSQVSNLISAINDHYGHYCFDGECSIEVMHPGSVLSYLSDEDDQWKNYKL